MKDPTQFYLNYLELIIISVIMAALIITLTAGIYAVTSGISQTLFPTLTSVILSATTLIAITSVTIRRRRVLAEHPELKTKPFKEFRLLKFAFKNAPIIISILIFMTLGSAGYIDRLLKNQVIAEAGIGISATFFNRSLIIELLEISPKNNENPAKVTAILHSEGYPDTRIENQEVGYNTTYIGRGRFIVRIVEIKNSSVKFFVERTTN